MIQNPTLLSPSMQSDQDFPNLPNTGHKPEVEIQVQNLHKQSQKQVLNTHSIETLPALVAQVMPQIIAQIMETLTMLINNQTK